MLSHSSPFRNTYTLFILYLNWFIDQSELQGFGGEVGFQDVGIFVLEPFHCLAAEDYYFLVVDSCCVVIVSGSRDFSGHCWVDPENR